MTKRELKQKADSFVESKYEKEIAELWIKMLKLAIIGNYSIEIGYNEEGIFIARYFDSKGFKFDVVYPSIYISWA